MMAADAPVLRELCIVQSFKLKTKRPRLKKTRALHGSGTADFNEGSSRK
jgi:hypothetical protein